MWDRAIRTNVYGYFFSARRFVQLRLAAGGGGKLLNASSFHADNPNAGGSDYDCSKGAIRILIPGADPAAPGDVARLTGPVHWGMASPWASSAVSSTSQGCTVRRRPRRTSRSCGAATPRCIAPWGSPMCPGVWRGDELAADLLHKGVYAAVTGAVYDTLRSSPRTGQPRSASWTSNSTRLS